MKHTILIVLLFSISVGHSFTLQGKRLEMTKRITSSIINNNYNEALSLIDSFQVNNSTDPLNSVLRLSVLGMRDVDFEQIIDSSLFLKTYQDAEDAISLYTESSDSLSIDSSYIAMLSGLTKAIHATFYLRQKKYLAAMKNGFNALDNMKQAQILDPQNYEVDFFLGLYEYARSELRSRLWWIFFWYPGNRAEGIKRIERCAQKSFITADAANISLCDIYLQNDRSAMAQKTIAKLKQAYPESRFVMWAEAKSFESQKKFKKAAGIYGTLSESYSNENFGTFNTLFTLYRKAEMLHNSGDIKSANLLCSNLLENDSLRAYNKLFKDIKKLREKSNGSKH